MKYGFFGLTWDYLFNDCHRLHRLSSHQVKFNEYHPRKSTVWVVKNTKSSPRSATNQLCARAGRPYGCVASAVRRALRSDGHHIWLKAHMRSSWNSWSLFNAGLTFSFCKSLHLIPILLSAINTPNTLFYSNFCKCSFIRVYIIFVKLPTQQCSCRYFKY